MGTPVLATKLYIPPPRAKVVERPRLIERLNESQRAARALGVTLISAPAGFGKTTLVREWIHQTKGEAGRMSRDPGHRGSRDPGKDEVRETLHPSSFFLHPSRVAWLSLDEADNDPARFLTYLVAALRTVAPTV